MIDETPSAESDPRLGAEGPRWPVCGSADPVAPVFVAPTPALQLVLYGMSLVFRLVCAWARLNAGYKRMLWSRWRKLSLEEVVTLCSGAQTAPGGRSGGSDLRPVSRS